MPLRTLAAVALFALAVAACFVSRPSEEFVCSTDADCTDGRTCDTGYCIVPDCPPDCDTCNKGQQTCVMNCSSDNECAGVTCPNGWSCTINCIGSDACDDVSCGNGTQCTIICSGDDACNNVSCRDGCECNLTCAPGACDSISCPTGQAGIQCTTDGLSGSPCVSTGAGCAKC